MDSIPGNRNIGDEIFPEMFFPESSTEMTRDESLLLLQVMPCQLQKLVLAGVQSERK